MKTCKCGCGIEIPANAVCGDDCTAEPEYVYDAGGAGDNQYACVTHDQEIMKGKR